MDKKKLINQKKILSKAHIMHGTFIKIGK